MQINFVLEKAVNCSSVTNNFQSKLDKDLGVIIFYIDNILNYMLEETKKEA
nr:MAG TPA: hypothetical protein [Caudoviricetes sp.]